MKAWFSSVGKTRVDNYTHIKGKPSHSYKDDTDFLNKCGK